MNKEQIGNKFSYTSGIRKILTLIGISNFPTDHYLHIRKIWRYKKYESEFKIFPRFTKQMTKFISKLRNCWKTNFTKSWSSFEINAQILNFFHTIPIPIDLYFNGSMRYRKNCLYESKIHEYRKLLRIN